MPLLHTDVAVKTSSIEAGKPTTIIITLYNQPAPPPVDEDDKAPTSIELVMGYVQLQGELIVDCAVIDPTRFVKADARKLSLASHPLDRRSDGNEELETDRNENLSLKEDPILFTTSSPDILCLYDEHLAKYNDDKYQYYHSDNSYYDDTVKKYGLFTTARQLLFVEDSAANVPSFPASQSSHSASPLSHPAVNGILGNQHRRFVINIGPFPANLPPSYIRTPNVQIKYSLIVGFHYRDSSGPAIRHKEGWFNVIVNNPGVGTFKNVFDLNVNTPCIFSDVHVTESPFLTDHVNIQNTSDSKKNLDIQDEYAFSISLKNTNKNNWITQTQKQKEFLRFAKTLISGKRNVKYKLKAFAAYPSSSSSLASPISSPSFLTATSSTANGDSGMTTPFSINKTKFEIMYKNNKKVCDILLSKPSYNIGDTIHIVVNCLNSVYKPFHITASLETEESILESDAVFFKTIERNSISTYSITKIKFEFTVPTTEPGQFQTNINKLQWLLKFQFIVLVPDTAEALSAGNELEKIDMGRQENDGVHFRIKENLPCDSFSCKIPVLVLSRKP